MTISRRTLLLLGLATLAAAPAFARRTHTSLVWEALGSNGQARLDARYKEYPGHRMVEQRVWIDVRGFQPGARLQISLDGRPLLVVDTDAQGRAQVFDVFWSPAVEPPKGRPAPNRRVDEGQVLRVYDPVTGFDVSAVFRFVGSGE